VPGRHLVIAAPAGPQTLQPNARNEEFTLSAQSNVYETLVDLDSGLSLRPGLAESWHTPDDVTWVFRLRPTVRLHDGRILDARMVAASLEHARSDPGSRRKVQLAALVRIEARDERTLAITTRAPFDPLPARLSNVSIWAPGADGKPVGTGPYRVTRFEPDGDVAFEAFAGHWAGPPRIASAEFRVLPSPADRVAALRAGTVQLVVDAPAEELSGLSAAGFRTVAENGLRVILLVMDSAHERRADGTPNPFRDPRVRRALALAIDRSALTSGPLGGYAELVDQIASPQELGGEHEDVARWPLDPAASRRLLAEAGYPDGFDVDLHFLPAKYRAMDAVAAALSADLGRIGVRVRKVPLPPPVFFDRVEARDLGFYVLGWISDTGDGRVSYEYLLHSPTGPFGLTNGGGYANPAVDALIERSSSRLEVQERREILARLAQLVHEDVPLVPLYRQADLYALRRDLTFRPRLDRRVRLVELAFGGTPAR
jgi:peptide/nickel transport system substrate-binding protein